MWNKKTIATYKYIYFNMTLQQQIKQAQEENKYPDMSANEHEIIEAFRMGYPFIVPGGTLAPLHKEEREYIEKFILSTYLVAYLSALEDLEKEMPEPLPAKPFTPSKEEELYNEGLETGFNGCLNKVNEAINKLKEQV